MNQSPFPPAGFLTDRMIRELAMSENMITPFVDYDDPESHKQNKISWGLSTCGYDVRLGTTFKRYKDTLRRIDPKRVSEIDAHTFTKTEPFEIEPRGFLLATTMEEFHLPDDIMGICISRSTYARCFSGDVTIMSNRGHVISFKDLFIQQEEFEKAHPGETFAFRGMGYDETHTTFASIPLSHIQKTGIQQLIRLTFDDGSSITCTPDHKFRIKNLSDDDVWDGTTTELEAQHLTEHHPIVQFRYHQSEQLRCVAQELVAEPEETYCLTSPFTGNFLLGNGICVNNCALICNVTPLVPGFSGRVTLEISNTTPHPVTLYPQEGICQFVFFGAVEGCEFDYGKRNGKYQNQTDTTLPRK